MSKLKGLLLTEGMHGMISQVEGLAKALGIDYIHQKVEINLLAKLLPPKITPVSNLFFKKFTVPEIDLVISCGRKSVIPSLYLKKNSTKKIVNIHKQMNMNRKVLKHLDMFSQPPKFMFARSNEETDKKYLHKFGSWPGLALTVLVMTICLGYLISLIE